MGEIEHSTFSRFENAYDSLAFYGDKSLVSSKVLDIIGNLFEKDPRIASFSFSDNLDVNDFQIVKSQTPQLNNVFLNKKLYDLVGFIPPSSMTAVVIEKWRAEASSRGLFHYELLPHESKGSIRLESQPTIASIAYENREVSEVDSRAIDWPSSISVLVDCEWLRENQTGSQVTAVSLITELAAHKRISKIGLINCSQEMPTYASHLLDLKNVQVIDQDGDRSSDIYWRPYQPSMDLNFLDLSNKSKRLVITFLDTISYDNESYFQTKADWQYYREQFRLAGLVSDIVVCISEDVRIQLTSDIANLDPKRVRVAELGTDHIEPRDIDNEPSNEKVRNLIGTSFVLILGSKYKHKNVDFGIKVVSEARRRGTILSLVIVGLVTGTETHVNDGSHPNWVTNLEHVDSNTRNWLIRHASAVLYPTSAEGFGLVPFEAARFNTPIVATKFGPMLDYLHPDYSSDSWNLDQYASLLTLLTSSEAAAVEQINHLNSIGDKLTWAKSTEKLVSAFAAAMLLPPIPTREVGNILSTRLNLEAKNCAELQSSLKSEIALNQSLKTSLSWRITAPIRALHKMIKNL